MGTSHTSNNSHRSEGPGRSRCVARRAVSVELSNPKTTDVFQQIKPGRFWSHLRPLRHGHHRHVAELGNLSYYMNERVGRKVNKHIMMVSAEVMKAAKVAEAKVTELSHHLLKGRLKNQSQSMYGTKKKNNQHFFNSGSKTLDTMKYMTLQVSWELFFFLSLMELTGRLDIVWDTGLPFSLKSSMWEGQCGSKPVNMTSKALGHLHWKIVLRADSYKFKSKLSWIAHPRWGLNQRLFVYLPSICVYECIHRYVCMDFDDIIAQVFAGIHINTRQRSKVVADQLIWRKKKLQVICNTRGCAFPMYPFLT